MPQLKKYDFLNELWFKQREFSSFLNEIKNPTEDQEVSIRIANKIIEDCMNNIYWDIKGRCPDEFYNCLLAGIEPNNKKILKGIFEMYMWIRRVIFNIQFSVDSSEITTFIETNKNS